MGPDDFPFNAVGPVLSGVGRLAWGATSLVGGFAWNATSLAYLQGLKGQLLDAAKNGQHDRVGALILLGADVDLTDKHGRTALWIAASLGHVQVVAKLLQQAREGKCSVDSEDKDLRTPLWMAAYNGHKDVVRLLMEYCRTYNLTKARMINQEDKDKNGPLKMACIKNNLPMVHLLCELGADLHSKDKDGIPPLVLAAKLGHHRVADYLKEQLLEWHQQEKRKHSLRFHQLSSGYQEDERQLAEQVLQKQQEESLKERLQESMKATLLKMQVSAFGLFGVQQDQCVELYQMQMAHSRLESKIQKLAQGALDLLRKIEEQKKEVNMLLEEMRTLEHMVQGQLAEAQKYRVQHGFGSQSKSSTSAPGANSRPAAENGGTASHPAGASTSSASPKTAAELELDRILNCATDHECLKLNPGASVEQVRRSYKKMAVAVHPDKCKLPRAAKAFQKLNNAHEKLSNLSG